MRPLTPTESKIIEIIKKWQKEYKNSPRVSILVKETGKRRSTVQRALYSLSKKGYIDLVYVENIVLIVPLFWE